MRFGYMVFLSLVGLSIGLFVGFNRKKWLGKCAELDDAAEELDRQLTVVQEEKDHSDNLHRLVSTIPLPIYLKDKEHRYIWANVHFETLAGKRRSELIGQTDYEIFPAPVADLFREQDQEVMGEGRPKTFEETVPLPSGIITFDTFKFPLTNDQGSIYALGGICTDITQLKAAEDRLSTEQNRLDTVLQHLDVGIITSDANGRVTMFNRKAAELTDQSKTAAIGLDLDDVYQAQDAKSGAGVHLNPGEDYQTADKHSVQNVKLITENGQARELVQKIIPLLDGFGQHAGILIILQGTSGMIKPTDQFSDVPGSLDAGPRPLGQGLVSTGLVLVMDDDRLVRKTTKLMLERGGYDVLLAKNGEEAISLYGDHMNTGQPISATIMDLTVSGGMGGVEATEHILALDPKAVILVASGYSNNPVLANYLAYGFLARVDKPFDLEDLLVTIRNILQ